MTSLRNYNVRQSQSWLLLVAFLLTSGCSINSDREERPLRTSPSIMSYSSIRRLVDSINVEQNRRFAPIRNNPQHWRKFNELHSGMTLRDVIDVMGTTDAQFIGRRRAAKYYAGPAYLESYCWWLDSLAGIEVSFYTRDVKGGPDERLFMNKKLRSR